MGRLQKLTDLAASSDIISNTSYNPAGQLLTMTGANGAPSETRTYNSIGQMTQLQSVGLILRTIGIDNDDFPYFWITGTDESVPESVRELASRQH